MREEITTTIFDYFIFLGVFQGIFLSWFFLKTGSKENKANLYQGLLIFFLSITIFEELLNNTGYIVRMLPISNYSEPCNFTFAPLIYLYIRNCFKSAGGKHSWVHFIPAFFWLGYMFFAFIQPNELKYNSYVETKQPDWEYLEVQLKISDDPLGLRSYINQLTLFQFVVYLFFSIRLLFNKAKELKQSFFKPENEQLLIIRNTLFHFVIIFFIYLGTKLYFGMHSDIGGYLIASYISFMIFYTSYNVMLRSDYFSHPQSLFNFPNVKYKKSSLTDVAKNDIYKKIKLQMEGQKFFKDNLASLSGLATEIKESTHHVSQVINEKFDMTFFELIAFYRIDEAKRLLIEDSAKKITIEELSERVGYNSKSSFNTAFKKLSKQTPSEFRKNL